MSQKSSQEMYEKTMDFIGSLDSGNKTCHECNETAFMTKDVHGNTLCGWCFAKTIGDEQKAVPSPVIERQRSVNLADTVIKAVNAIDI